MREIKVDVVFLSSHIIMFLLPPNEICVYCAIVVIALLNVITDKMRQKKYY